MHRRLSGNIKVLRSKVVDVEGRVVWDCGYTYILLVRLYIKKGLIELELLTSERVLSSTAQHSICKTRLWNLMVVRFTPHCTD